MTVDNLRHGTPSLWILDYLKIEALVSRYLFEPEDDIIPFSLTDLDLESSDTL